MSMPVGTREGDDYVWTWPDSGLVMVLAELREHREEMHGELTVYSTGADGERYHISGPTKQNLLSTQTRGSLAKALALRDDQSRKEDIWATWIEQAFVNTVRGYRLGEPMVVLNGTMAERQVRKFLVLPLLPLGESTMLYADGESGKGYMALFCA